MARRYLRASEKKELIECKIKAFQKHWYDGFKRLDGVTLAQVARLTGYSKSTRLRETLYSMVDDGQLVMVVQSRPEGVADTVCIFYHPEYAPRKLL